jgi:flagellin
LPDGGNEQLADQLRAAAASVAALTSGGANSLSSGNLEAAQTIVDEATGTFAEARGTIGAYQKYELETRQNSLAVERENLMAAHSAIADADFAEEMSNLSRQRVLTAASAQVLRISNQNAQTVLNLLA